MRAMEALSQLEEMALTKLVSGDHPVLVALQRQLVGAAVESRRFTGVGFFVHLRLRSDAQPIEKGRVVVSGVHVSLAGMEHGAGFVLFTKNGLADTLEGYSLSGEPWPSGSPSILSIDFDKQREADIGVLGSSGAQSQKAPKTSR